MAAAAQPHAIRRRTVHGRARIRLSSGSAWSKQRAKTKTIRNKSHVPKPQTVGESQQHTLGLVRGLVLVSSGPLADRILTLPCDIRMLLERLVLGGQVPGGGLG